VDDEVLEAWEMDVGEDVVHGNERVLEVCERPWKGKKVRQQCFGGGGDLEARGRGNARGAVLKLFK
jgi:hypothetical protein